MHPRRRLIRPVNVATTATVQQRANKQKYRHVRVSDSYARNSFKTKINKYEAKIHSDTRTVMTVPIYAKDNTAHERHDAKTNFTSVSFHSQRNDQSLSGKQYCRQPVKAELQHGMQYTERVTEQLDEILANESLNSHEHHAYKFSVVDDNQRPRTVIPVSQVPETSNDSGFITSDAISFTSPCGRSTPKGEVGHVAIPNVKSGQLEIREDPTFVQRVVYAVPECIRRLKLHYQARKMQDITTYDDTPEEPKVANDNEEYYDLYPNWTLRKPSPLPHLREARYDSISGKSDTRRSFTDTLVKLSGIVTKRAHDIYDEEGIIVSPGDCVWVSKPYLSAAIYVGKQTVIRCVGNEIVKEMLDPFSTLWKATFTKGYVSVLSRQEVLLAAKLQVGDSFIGTNDEFILNCLTNLDSLEAYELGFRLHDPTGANLSLPELF